MIDASCEEQLNCPPGSTSFDFQAKVGARIDAFSCGNSRSNGSVLLEFFGGLIPCRAGDFVPNQTLQGEEISAKCGPVSPDLIIFDPVKDQHSTA